MINQKGFNYDLALRLKDAGAVTASGNATVGGSAQVLDLGEGRFDGRAVCDVSAIDVATGDESYVLQLQGSLVANFASGVVALASKQLGGATPTGNSAASVVGRYEIPFANEENGVRYRYVRLRYVIAGTTPSINLTAVVAPAAA